MPGPQLHLVTDSGLPLPRLLTVVSAAVTGGVDVVQVRDQAVRVEGLVALTREVSALVAGRALVIVNGSVAVALQAGANGVHLPEDHPDLASARQALGPAAYIGASVHSVAAARRAEQAGVSSVTFGHIYATGSHPGEPARGLEALRDVVAAVAIPVIAIGGVDATRALEVLAAGAAGVAVISAISRAADPGDATKQLRSALGTSSRGKPARRASVDPSIC
jgi:thiamine-phosphate diphosphorylase